MVIVSIEASDKKEGLSRKIVVWILFCWYVLLMFTSGLVFAF
jgi:hypothetical protein